LLEPSAARLSWPLELLTRGFASLPFDSFALSLVKILRNIIEHFEDEVKYYSDWALVCLSFFDICKQHELKEDIIFA
jgi:hypothetical protein